MAEERGEPSTLIASIDDDATGRWQITYAPSAATMNRSCCTESSTPASATAAASSSRSASTRLTSHVTRIGRLRPAGTQRREHGAG